MDVERVLALLGGLRRDVEAVAAGVAYAHPGMLTFERARELTLEPGLWTAEVRAHVAGCRRCARLVECFRRDLAASASAARWRSALRGLLGALLGVVPVVVNWFLWSRPVQASLSTLDWWEIREHRFVGAGRVLAVLMAAVGVALWQFGLFRGRRALAPWLSVIGFVVASGFFLLLAEGRQAQIRRSLDAIFLEHRWIAYEPPGYNPYPDKKRVPREEELRKDLEVLHRIEKGGGGFTGLITFGSEGALAEVPRIAKAVGFRAVIMGIHIPLENGSPGKPDFAPAVAARDWVDGYCLGHNTPTVLDFDTLAAWMDELRRATDRPVTTTARLGNYLGERGQRVREIGDWYFPDVGGAWRLGTSPKVMAREMHQALRDVTQLPRDKPVLLKMVSYPSGGADGLTEQNQADFYAEVCRELSLPDGVYLSFFAGYDLPWKRHEDHPEEWSKPEEHVGLFTAERRPKLAAEIVRKYSPIQRRP